MTDDLSTSCRHVQLSYALNPVDPTFTSQISLLMHMPTNGYFIDNIYIFSNYLLFGVAYPML